MYEQINQQGFVNANLKYSSRELIFILKAKNKFTCK